MIVLGRAPFATFNTSTLPFFQCLQQKYGTISWRTILKRMIHYGKNTLIRRLCLMNAWWMNGIRLLTFSSSFVGYFLLPSQYINCLSSNRAQVALFISILTSFIDSTISQLQRNPADITNDLLVAIYNQQVAQSSNISIPPVNPTSYFNLSQADYDAAVTQNALLYITLSLFIVVSVIALVAKLWLVSYSSQVFSVGSPYDRVMKRQEAYNGVLVWNLGGVINMLAVILLIALLLFGLYV